MRGREHTQQTPMEHLAQQEFVVGKWRVQPDLDLVSCDSATVHLEPKVMLVLVCLAEHAGEVVSKEDLMRTVWADTFVTDQVLTHAIWKLRQALADGGKRSEVIETIPKRGYRLVCPVEVLQPAAAKAAAALSRETAASGWKYSTLALMAILTLTVVAAALFYARHSPPITEKDEILLADFLNTAGDPTFNGALKTAVAVKLEESPYLNIVSEARARDTLRMMQKPDEKLVGTLAGEACRRLNVKALLNSSIEKIGSRYVVTLEAVNCQNGETLAWQQAEASSRERVLASVGLATSKLRGKLGESIRSVESYDTPLEEATTSSLEALQAFTLAWAEQRKARLREAIGLYQRAVELDPRFTLAYRQLGICCSLLGERQRAAEYLQKAFDLRERASERERYRIISAYQELVTGELEKSVLTAQLVKHRYPRDYLPYNALGTVYRTLGRHEQALAEFREIRQFPSSAVLAHNLGVTPGRI